MQREFGIGQGVGTADRVAAGVGRGSLASPRYGPPLHRSESHLSTTPRLFTSGRYEPIGAASQNQFSYHAGRRLVSIAPARCRGGGGTPHALPLSGRLTTVPTCIGVQATLYPPIHCSSAIKRARRFPLQSQRLQAAVTEHCVNSTPASINHHQTDWRAASPRKTSRWSLAPGGSQRRAHLWH